MVDQYHHGIRLVEVSNGARALVTVATAIIGMVHSTTCATACGTDFVNAFRAWSRLQPVEWRNGKGEITVSRPRSGNSPPSCAL